MVNFRRMSLPEQRCMNHIWWSAAGRVPSGFLLFNHNVAKRVEWWWAFFPMVASPFSLSYSYKYLGFLALYSNFVDYFVAAPTTVN